MGIVVSTIHASVKFHTPCGIGTVTSKIKEGRGLALEREMKHMQRVDVLTKHRILQEVQVPTWVATARHGQEKQREDG
ncbi:hypothetical protein Tco_1035450 [Tanacetum coccineum]